MSKLLGGSKRYRILGWVFCNAGGYTTKGQTIYQCDSFEDALNRLRVIHEENLECTYFTIERGEWL